MTKRAPHRLVFSLLGIAGAVHLTNRVSWRIEAKAVHGVSVADLLADFLADCCTDVKEWLGLAYCGNSQLKINQEHS